MDTEQPEIDMKREEAMRILHERGFIWMFSAFTSYCGVFSKVILIASEDEFWKMHPSIFKIRGLTA